MWPDTLRRRLRTKLLSATRIAEMRIAVGAAVAPEVFAIVDQLKRAMSHALGKV